MKFEEKKISDLNINLIDGDRGKNYPKNNEIKNSGYCLFLNAKNVTANDFNFAELNYISFEKDQALRNGKLNRKDIILTTRGTVGNIAYYSENIPFDNIRINSGMIIIRCSDKINEKYLYWYMKSKEFQNQIKELQTGSAQPQLPIAIIRNMTIKLFDIYTQNKIVKILDTIQEKIIKNNNINNNLYEIIKRYLTENYYKNASMDKQEIQNIAKIQGGYAFKSNDLLNTKTDNKIFKIKNISNSGVEIENTQYVSDKVANRVDSKFELFRGDVIIAMTGAELGKTGYLYGKTYRYFLNQRVSTIKGFTKEKTLYLNCIFLLDELQTLLNSKGYGSAQPNISTSDIEKIILPIPNENELENFYRFANPIYNKMILKSEENETLKQLRDTLLPKLMNGEIDLDKIEI